MKISANDLSFNVVGTGPFSNENSLKIDNKVGTYAKDTLNKEESKKTQEKNSIETQLDEIDTSNYIASLNSKMSSGQNLSDKEIQYLKTKDPELYERAVTIKTEREAYEAQLENAESKEEVEQIQMQKVQQFATEIKGIKDDNDMSEAEKDAAIGLVGTKMTNDMSEYANFVTSEKYEELEGLDEEEKFEQIPLELEDFIHNERDGSVDELVEFVNQALQRYNEQNEEYSYNGDRIYNEKGEIV